jgi:hypothetical protein
MNTHRWLVFGLSLPLTPPGAALPPRDRGDDPEPTPI